MNAMVCNCCRDTPLWCLRISGETWEGSTRGDGALGFTWKRNTQLNESRIQLLAPTGAMWGCHGSARAGRGGSQVSSLLLPLLLLVPTGPTAPARQWTESTAAQEWFKSGSQQTETGIWAEHRFRTKAWVSPLRQGLRVKEMRRIQERSPGTPFILWPQPQMIWLN